MAEITITCSKCGSEFLIDETHAGDTVACSQCQSTILVPLAGIKPGRKIADFEVIRKLGVGGMGEVWLAKQVSMDRDVALKILSPALTDNEEFVTRFAQEVKMAGKLHHQNIVAAHYAGVDNGVNFLAIEFVEGVELEVLMKSQTVIPEQQALEIAKSMASALKYAWDKFKILHRDIKPSNIMINSDNEPMLMDMGISKSLAEDKNLTMTGMVVGTPYYMSPEQCRADSKLDFRADLYSLGSTLYHMVTGSVPYDATNATGIIAKHITEVFPPPQKRNSDISDQCAVLLEIMMAKSPDERQESWDDLIRDIDLVLQGQFPKTERPAIGMSNVMQGSAIAMPQQRVEKGSSMKPIVGVAAVSIVVTIGALFGLMKMMEKDDVKGNGAGILTSAEKQQNMTDIEDRVKEVKNAPKVLAKAAVPANLTQKIEIARTKNGPVLVADKNNWKSQIKKLKPGMVLRLQPGHYNHKDLFKIECDNVIIEGSSEQECQDLMIDLYGKNNIVRSLNAKNIQISGNCTIVDSVFGSSISLIKGDFLVFNSIFGRYYPAAAQSGKITFINCTIHPQSHCDWVPVICKGCIETSFINCVIGTINDDLVLVSIMPNFTKKLNLVSCLLKPVKKQGAVSSDYSTDINNKYFKNLAEMAKWVNLKNCIIKKPIFTSAKTNNFKLAAGSPGLGIGPDGQNLGANLNNKGLPF